VRELVEEKVSYVDIKKLLWADELCPRVAW